MKEGCSIQEKETYSRDAIVEEILALARGPANDGVKLCFLSEPTKRQIDALDLRSLVEFKRDEKGKVELKFTDRLHAFELLLTHMRSEEEERDAAFLRALSELGEKA